MDIMGVNDKQFSVTISMYFAVKWDEPRIETNNTVTEGIYIILERLSRGICHENLIREFLLHPAFHYAQTAVSEN